MALKGELLADAEDNWLLKLFITDFTRACNGQKPTIPGIF